MKLFGASSLLYLLSSQGTAINKANAQVVATIPCPAAGAPHNVIPSSTTANTTVHIPIISNVNGLCTLVRHNSTDNTQRAPVARSYSNNDWEVSAGLFSGRKPAGTSNVPRVVVSCNLPHLDPAECEVVLPPLEHPTQEYILESFVYETSPQVEAARFLEQATFGPTRETIDDMVATSNDFKTWIHDQMNNVPVSSFRKFYRERVNPKWEHSYHSGTVSSQPCELYSRWRKYAISSKDIFNNRKTDIYKILIVTYEASIGYVWRVDGEFRTITQEPPEPLDYYKSLQQNREVPDDVFHFQFYLGKKYRFKYMSYWQMDCVGCIIALHPPDVDITKHKGFFGISNPPVNFAGYESQLEFGVLNLPTFKSPDFPVIDNPDEYYSGWEKFFGRDENSVLNTASLEGSAQCDGMYNFRQPRLNKQWAPNSAEVYKTFPPIFGKSLDGHMFLYDPHLALPENSVENPSPDGGGQLVLDTHGLNSDGGTIQGKYDGTTVGCQNAVMSYQNEKNCKLSYLTTTCTPGESPNEVIILNDANLEGIRATTGKKIYAVTWPVASNQPGTPCGPGDQTSRWIKDEDDSVCLNSMNLHEESIRLFQDIIDQRGYNLVYQNDEIVDAVKSWRSCHPNDVAKPLLGKVKTRDGTCWKHTHKMDMSVVDLTSVAGIDAYLTPGSSVITLTKEDQDLSLDIEALHVSLTIGRYGDHMILPVAGILGDGKTTVKLPSPLNDAVIQATFKTVEFNPSARPVLICGTPDEVSSDPLHGDRGFTVVEPEGTGFRSRKIDDLSSQRHTIWHHFALNHEDQLRQRMAWALSQIIAVGLPGSGMTFYEVTEDRLAMYDFYMKRAFANYRDLLKDFSYNRIMASWLSFYENKSLQSSIVLPCLEGNGCSGNIPEANYPDENYAREIMQLFSIGLYQLNQDGSNTHLDNGKLAETYTIEDILSYSRVWTGFRSPPQRHITPKRAQPIARGGNSLSGRQWPNTPFEPMEINVDWRDHFPKSDLMNGYIGDRVPLCVDLPEKHALRKGAVYKLLGSDQRGLTGDPLTWDSIPDLKRLELSSTSPLFTKLCAEGANGECTFPSLVELDENLMYNVDDNHQEFEVDTLRVIKLRKGSSGIIHYEYIRQPCVEHSFFENGKKVFWGTIVKNKRVSSKLDSRQKEAWEMEASMCAHPGTEAAVPMCSNAGWETRASSGYIHCNYHGERAKFNTAEGICQALEPPLVLGQPAQFKATTTHGGPCSEGMQSGVFRAWTSKSCGVKVKIDIKSGQVAIVHSPAEDGNDVVKVTPRVEPMVSETETMNFFKVPWTNNGTYPNQSKCLMMSSSGTCKIHVEKASEDDTVLAEYCICNTDTRETQVFSSVSAGTWKTASNRAILSLDDLRDVLFVGAVDPSTFDAGIYTNVGDCGMTGASVYTTNGGSCSTLSPESIFAFKWKSKQYFLKNVVSMVHVDDTTGNDYSFRNPVQFHSLANPSARDSVHETEAVIDTLFYHPNHPPFMAIRIIQRFGISNPSPQFIHRVATAYSTGLYGQFGSGEYGDLGAMAAAILLDDESRQVVLDTDQAHGQLREPLIKVTSLFRSQGLQYKSPLMIPNLMDTTQGTKRTGFGQGAFETQSVFSFFLPEFSPPGVVKDAGQFAPESMVMQGDNVLELMEGMMSITKFGVVDCDRVAAISFSRTVYKFEHLFNCPTTEGDTSHSPATMSYWPSSVSSVDDILDELALLMTAGRLSPQNRAIIKPIVSVPFNSGDIAKAVRAAQQLIWSAPEVHATNIPRSISAPRPNSDDTPNNQAPYKAVVVLMMLGGTDSFNMLVPTDSRYDEYATARGPHKIKKESLLPLVNTPFGVNPYLPTVAKYYNDGEGLFFTNLGTLAKPMTNADDFVKESPFQLYAHNTMQHEFYTGDPYEENPGTGVFGRMLDMLRERDYSTSANSVSGGGETMLTGDQEFNNPVWNIGIKPPNKLDMTPTVENLYDMVKEINGIGEVGNSFLSDTWSTRLSTALFQHEKLEEIKTKEVSKGVKAFAVTNYEMDRNEYLPQQFHAVAEFIKSRDFRKVNRDVFVIPHASYDLHAGDSLFELFEVVDPALENFIKELKEQEISDSVSVWDNTVIVMASDFGRTLNSNANGGTDHAWGGNYFMLGGGVKGGRILGEYPNPLSPSSSSWIARGRLIPTTPWEAVWNGIGQWLGLTGANSDKDLNFALPNRDKFDKCKLFTDKDLFNDGVCDCTSCETTYLAPITSYPTSKLTPKPTSFNPPPSTSNPTPKPTQIPTQIPTPSPLPGVPSTASPSKAPSNKPTANPTTPGPSASPSTRAPTIPLPEGALPVATVLDADSTVVTFGCGDISDAAAKRAVDETTEKFICLRSGTISPSLVVTPSRLSIAKGLRIYSHNNCPNCDAVSYIVEGRSISDWIQVSEGDLPWKNANPVPDRNARGQVIEPGDPSFVSTYVSFENDAIYSEYRLTFPETRDSSAAYLQFAEVHLSGYIFEGTLTAAPQTPSPTASPIPPPTLPPITAYPTTFQPTASSSTPSTTSSVCQGNLLANGNFDDGLTDWRGWGGASVELTTGVTGNAAKAHSRTSWRSGPRQDLWQDDLACLVPGTFVHFEFKARLVDDVTGEGVSCDTSSSADCPMVTVRHATWDYVYDRNSNASWDPNGWNSFHGVYQVLGDWTTAVYVMICGGQPGTSLIVDDVSIVIGNSFSPTPGPSGSPLTTSPVTASPTTSIPTSVAPITNAPTVKPTVSPVIATPVCEGNLLANGNFDDGLTDWRGWGGASVELTTGVTGNAAKAHSRTSWRSGPRQDLVADDLTCLVPGTFAHIEFKARLVDDVTGEGVSCDTSSSTDCPMVTVRHATWDYVYDRNSNASWDPNGWNSFHGVYQVLGDWTTAVYVMICGGQPGTSLIVDDVSIVIGNSFSPTPGPSGSPLTTSPVTASPITSIPTSAAPITNAPIAIGGTPTNNIFDVASTITTTGCTMEKDSTKTRAIDGNTNKFLCFKEAGATEHGIVVSPGHGQLSLAQSLRIYTHNNCGRCDGVSYNLKGRIDASSPWVDIGGGNLPWYDASIGRNAQGIMINSSYESGDTSLHFTEVPLSNNMQQFLEYRLVFPETRNANYYLQLGEVELVGVLY